MNKQNLQNTNSNNHGDSKEVINVVLEWSKQITTLSSGTLVLSATFVKDIFQGTVLHQWVLVVSWLLFALSAIFGIILLGNICFLFSSHNTKQPSIYNCATRTIALFHCCFFGIGLALFFYFASYNFINTNKIKVDESKSKPKISSPINQKINKVISNGSTRTR